MKTLDINYFANYHNNDGALLTVNNGNSYMVAIEAIKDNIEEFNKLTSAKKLLIRNILPAFELYKQKCDSHFIFQNVDHTKQYTLGKKS